MYIFVKLWFNPQKSILSLNSSFEVKKSFNSAEHIFNKYAKEYLQKYHNVDLYLESLNVFLGDLKQNANVLELACGPGNLTKKMLSLRPDLNILGLDVAGKMIDLAKINNPSASFLRMDCRFMSNIKRKFDAVIAGFLLPYLNPDEVRQLFNDVNGLLKEDGLFYLSFMENGGEAKGFQKSNIDEEDILLTYYYEKEELINKLRRSNFKLETSYTLVNNYNVEGVTDMILIVRKL